MEYIYYIFTNVIINTCVPNIFKCKITNITDISIVNQIPLKENKKRL